MYSYMYINISLSLSLSVYIYIYIYKPVLRLLLRDAGLRQVRLLILIVAL